MNLSEGERNHPLWLKIESHLKERIGILRAKNDGPLDAVQTATIRGQTAEAKAMIAWGLAPIQDSQ